MNTSLNIVILGLSISSSWGNGHATTYRALVKSLAARGHRVLFLERDVPWYSQNRDLPKLQHATLRFYKSLVELKRKYRTAVRDADLCIVGSYVPDGVEVGLWVNRTTSGVAAFYDIDTPITLTKLKSGDDTYLTAELVPLYDLYLSFTGGPLLRKIEKAYRARLAKPFYCSVDPQRYFPESTESKWDMGYMGTYSDDRQEKLETLLLKPAQDNPRLKMVVAGPLYPEGISWPRNVERIEHIAPDDHRHFYNSQRFTLNLTRSDMIEAGYSPSVRLFEAAACATPIISDYWPGLETFFEPDREILIAANADDALRYLRDVSDSGRKKLGERARARVLKHHTSDQRALELERLVNTVRERSHLVARDQVIERALA
jgi:spore maturation protein CgeB